MDAKEFYRQLDALYRAEDIAGAYDFLCAQKQAARDRGDDALSLTVANALLGHCREHCLFDEIDGHFREALRCIASLGLEGTMEEALTLLNAATDYCVMGREEESEELYRRAEALHRELLPPGDPRLAAVFNNHGLLYRAQGKREKAAAAFRQALDILLAGNGAAGEAASSRLNLASVCDDLETAEKLAAEASAYYATEAGSTDNHRFTARALEAELSFRRGDYGEAGRRFEKTAEEWEAYGGARQRKAVLLRNALLCYEKAGQEEAAGRLRAQLAEAEE
ncbi:MAG: tetratricopeptide repeat protein [Oscillospiraceae bacterium]|nr:tetratricopeptide repeat protein [Oscillospiraceae bacterium]MBR4692694.1 tetratricopeptide repeat protein [Oscillospiraceae bacterium]